MASKITSKIINKLDLIHTEKTIHDSIHGLIGLSVFATKIIDTKYFQRLRKLKQLATAFYVYPNAVHTRFEHSIGTYHLAGLVLDKIIHNSQSDIINESMNNIIELEGYYSESNSDNKLDKYICELVKIAALCHDIGHGPFSHVFDDEFLSKKQNNKYNYHENRSCLLLELIIKNDSILNDIVSDKEIQFMKNLINPTDEHKGFIYQIVSNDLNSLDVDKYDYLIRDIKTINYASHIDHIRLINQIKIHRNMIVYPEQIIGDIYNLFDTRYRLHKHVYNHKAVISVSLMIILIFELLDDILHISKSIENIETDIEPFCNLTDDYILEAPIILNSFRHTLSQEQNINLDKALNIINMISNRKIYPIVYSKYSKTCDLTTIKEVIKKIDPDLLDNIHIICKKIGFVSGNKQNPFDSIYMYKAKNINNNKIESIYKKDKSDIFLCSSLDTYQEHLIMIFYNNKDDLETINKLKQSLNDL